MIGHRLSGFIVVGLLAMACTSNVEPPVVSPPPTPTADDIVKAMASTYRSAPAYSDRGEQVEDFTKFKARRTFSTAFVRPDRFRFEYRDEGDPNRPYVIWTDGTGVFSQWYVRPGIVATEAGLGEAIGAAAGGSSRTSYTIPGLLMPELVGGFTLVASKDLRIDGSEAIGGHMCWRLVGHSLRGD